MSDSLKISAPQRTERALPRNAESVFRFIVRYKWLHAGESPSRRDIMSGVGISSLSVVSYYLMRLEEAGWIVLPSDSRARGIGIPGERWYWERPTVTACSLPIAPGTTGRLTDSPNATSLSNSTPDCGNAL